jgi:hypothetical protein
METRRIEMNLWSGPTWIGGKIDVELFPINNAVGQGAGSHDMNNQCSMSPQSLIEGFQMSHGSHRHFEQGTVAAAQLMHLKDFWKLLGCARF